MRKNARAGLVCLGLAVVSVITAVPSSAQTSFVVSDLGKANTVTLDQPDYVHFCPYGAALCKDEILMNGAGQIAIRKARPNTAANNYILYWEPALASPITFGGGDSQFQLAALSSSNGWIAGTQNGGVQSAFAWSRAQGYRRLEGPEWYLPLAVNANGVVVGFSDVSTHRALVWFTPATATLLDDLNIAGKERWTFQEAQGIADDGSISGIGLFTTSTGATETHDFLLTPANGPMDRSDWTVVATEASPSDPPRNAIDSDLNTRWSTGDAQHDSQGFIVSWQGDRTIGRIRIEVGPSTDDYPRTCGIWVKDSVGNVTFVNCAADANGNVDVSFAPILANKIEVWQWGSTGWWWSIAEFNVFAK